MKEISGVDRAIIGTLSADVALRDLGVTSFSTDQADQSAGYPLCLVSLLSGPGLVAQGGDTVYQRPLMLVKFVGQTEAYEDLEPLIWRATELLDRQKFEVALPGNAGSVWVTLHRDESGTVRFPDFAGGKHYRHLGEHFRAFAYVLPGQGGGD